MTAMTQDANLIPIVVSMDQIKAGNYLLGRYDQDSDHLTEIRTIVDSKSVPHGTAKIRFELLSEDPLDTFVKDHCEGWDGTSGVKLFFNRENAAYVTWEIAHTGAAAA